LLVAAWRWRDSPVRAGLALGLCVLGKPFVLGLLPLLLLARRGRWAAATAGALLVFALASAGLSGLVLNREYLTQVLPRAARYGCQFGMPSRQTSVSSVTFPMRTNSENGPSATGPTCRPESA